MQVTVHGNAHGNVRHDFTRPGEDSPETKLLRARALVQQLEREHENARTTLRQALESDDDDRDFNALKSIVTRKARELAQAEESVAGLEAHVTQQQLAELPSTIAALRAAREEFASLHRRACIALGKCAELAVKAVELTNLEARQTGAATQGNIFYSPHRKEVSALAACPRPSFAGASFTGLGYDWHVKIVPTRGTEEK